jgi:hypothetical protein
MLTGDPDVKKKARRSGPVREEKELARKIDE